INPVQAANKAPLEVEPEHIAIRDVCDMFSLLNEWQPRRQRGAEVVIKLGISHQRAKSREVMRAVQLRRRDHGDMVNALVRAHDGGQSSYADEEPSIRSGLTISVTPYHGTGHASLFIKGRS